MDEIFREEEVRHQTDEFAKGGPTFNSSRPARRKLWCFRLLVAIGIRRSFWGRWNWFCDSLVLAIQRDFCCHHNAMDRKFWFRTTSLAGAFSARPRPGCRRQSVFLKSKAPTRSHRFEEMGRKAEAEDYYNKALLNRINRAPELATPDVFVKAKAGMKRRQPIMRMP